MIKAKNYLGNTCCLVNMQGDPVELHDEFELSDNTKVFLRGGTAPHKSSSQGKVWVSRQEEDMSETYYPSVLQLKWVDVDFLGLRSE